jgi:Ran GTPase-activating protein (RanGAP) involved in mRNA processing and transport
MKSQKYLAVIGSDKNPNSEAFNVSKNRFENYPDDTKDADFHFESEDQAKLKMREIGVVVYQIEEAYFLEDFNA